MQKLDPYINVDPGTMNPFEHGEVFVTDDGGETDLDLGHYERFIDERLSPRLERHDRLDLLGRARRRAPGRLPRQDRAGHPAHHRRDQAAHQPPGRRRRRRGHHRDRRHRRRHRDPPVPRGHPAVPPRRRPRQRLLHPRHARAVHRAVRRAEDQADPALGHRAAQPGHPARRHRLPQRARRSPTASSARSPTCATCPSTRWSTRADARNIYEIPLVLHEEGLDDVVCSSSACPSTPTSTSPSGRPWSTGSRPPSSPVRIGLIGKYVSLPGRLPVGGRGAQARRLPPRRRRRDRLDPGRGRRGAAGRRAGCATSTAS